MLPPLVKVKENGFSRAVPPLKEREKDDCNQNETYMTQKHNTHV